MAGTHGYQYATGTAEVLEGDENQTVIAAITNKTLRVTKATISVTVAAVGGGGEVALEDGVGGTRLFEADADAVGVYSIDLGPIGYPLTADTALNLTVDGAVTTQATARATVLAIAT